MIRVILRTYLCSETSPAAHHSPKSGGFITADATSHTFASKTAYVRGHRLKKTTGRPDVLGRSVRCSTTGTAMDVKPANCFTSSRLFAVCETSSYATPTCNTYYLHPSVSYRDCFCAFFHFAYRESISQALFNLLVPGSFIFS